MRSIKSDYKKFCDEISSITRFRSLTQLSYGLATAMIKDGDDDKFISIRKGLSSTIEKKSYCAGDREVKSVTLVSEWISADEYAKRYGLDADEVKIGALRGEYGYYIDDDNVVKVIWPKEEQSNDIKSLPGIGKKKFSVKFKYKMIAQVSLEDDDKDSIMALIGTSDTTKNTLNVEAGIRLNQNCFLACWSVFEAFIRNSIYTLLEVSPDSVFVENKIGKLAIPLKEVYEFSDGFSNIEKLKRYVADVIISQYEKSGHSIHAMINLMKEYFLRNRDPYKAWYVFHDKNMETSYDVLMDIKEIRNSLMHEKGGGNELLDKLRIFGKPVNGVLEINNDMYEQCVLILRAIAHKVKCSIGKLEDEKCK